MGQSATGEPVSLHALWTQRQIHQFNGVPYIIQKASTAIYPRGNGRCARRSLLHENARIIHDGLVAVGLTVYGARNTPYISVDTGPGLGSWRFFDRAS